MYPVLKGVKNTMASKIRPLPSDLRFLTLLLESVILMFAYGILLVRYSDVFLTANTWNNDL